jgi:hypothetical protein
LLAILSKSCKCLELYCSHSLGLLLVQKSAIISNLNVIMIITF